MRLDLTGRERTDITPLLAQAWTYGETIELGPSGTYYGRPHVFPATRPWGYAAMVLEGCGYQGVSIQPDPAYPWRPGEVMWTFAAGKVRVSNFLWGSGTEENAGKVNFVQFGDGARIYDDCEFSHNDIRQYKTGFTAKKISELRVHDNMAYGGGPVDDGRQAYHIQNCNGLKGRDNWTQGSRNLFIEATEAGGGMNEGFAWLGGGMAEVWCGVEMAGGDCFQFGSGETCFDSCVGGTGIYLRGSSVHPVGCGTITGWLGGNSTKCLIEGPGAFQIKFLGCHIVSNMSYGREDGIVFQGVDYEPFKGLVGGVWQNTVVATNFVNLGRAIVLKGNAERRKPGSGNNWSLDIDPSTQFIGCQRDVVHE